MKCKNRVCGKDFTPHYASDVYCSHACAREAVGLPRHGPGSGGGEMPSEKEAFQRVEAASDAKVRRMFAEIFSGDDR